MKTLLNSFFFLSFVLDTLKIEHYPYQAKVRKANVWMTKSIWTRRFRPTISCWAERMTNIWSSKMKNFCLIIRSLMEQKSHSSNDRIMSHTRKIRRSTSANSVMENSRNQSDGTETHRVKNRNCCSNDRLHFQAKRFYWFSYWIRKWRSSKKKRKAKRHVWNSNDHLVFVQEIDAVD